MRNTLNYVRSYRVNGALSIINNLCGCCLMKKKILNISHFAIRQRNWQTPKCCVVRLGFDRIDDGKKSIALFQLSFTILHGRPVQKTIRPETATNSLRVFLATQSVCSTIDRYLSTHRRPVIVFKTSSFRPKQPLSACIRFENTVRVNATGLLTV